MNRVGEFEKVSFEQFRADILGENVNNVMDSETVESNIQEMYNSIRLPQRATSGSAGYDFFAPFGFLLEPGETVKIPTGIRVLIDDGWWLGCFPRSGLGFKYRMQLNNTVGVIDEDYAQSDNEGHIFAKITNDSKTGAILRVDAGEAFMQGIFIPFGITYSDNATGIRNGGFGSTDSK